MINDILEWRWRISRRGITQDTFAENHGLKGSELRKILNAAQVINKIHPSLFKRMKEDLKDED